MSEICFTVYGNPKGQPRVKAYSRGGRAGVYDPGTADDWKYAVRQAAIENAPEEKFTGAVNLMVSFYFQRPKRLLKKSSPGHAIPHAGKPDLDNLVKAVKDALSDSGVVWNDDSQAWYTMASKQYVSKERGEPRAEIHIREHGS